MEPDRREVPLADFLAEAWELLGALESAASARPGGAGADPAVLLHRLKGSAALYGLPAVSRLAAALEARAGAGDGAREALAAGAAWLRGAFAAIEREGAAGEPALEALADRLPELAAPEGAAGDPIRERLLAFARRDPEVLADFLGEAEEYVDAVSAALAGAPGGADREDADEVLRPVHTLKGTAYMVGCDPVGRLADVMEDVLQAAGGGAAGRGATGLGGEAWSALGEAAAMLRRMLDTLGGGGHAGLDGDLRRVLARLAALGAGAPPALAEAPSGSGPSPGPPAPETAPPSAGSAAGSSARGVVRVGVDRLDRVVGQVGELVVARGRIEGRLDELEAAQELLETVRRRMLGAVREFQEKYLDPRSGPAAAGPRADEPARFAEVELDRYDDFNLLARRIGEVENDLREIHLEVDRVNRALRRDAVRFGELTRGLRQEVTRARLVPVDRLLARFERLASGLARDEGKEVRLEVSGGGVELDTAVAQEVAEPLLHLARNAVSHGLETPDERRAAGKEAAGVLALRAYPEGRFIHLEVEDDGRGVDLDGLKRRAVELGVLTPERAAGLGRREALDLVFRAGLSTREEVTAGAGRGMGMDIVRAAVARLHGEIELETEPGVGTRITLRVPLTQVVSEALWLRVGDRRFLLPTLTVRTLLQVSPDRIATRDDGGREIPFEGGTLPLVGLAASLGLPEPPAGAPLTVVVVRVVDRSFGLAADEILGLREVMVQGLGELLSPLGHLAGAAVSGDGEVVLLLDPLAFAPGGRLAELPPVAAIASAPEPRGIAVLLVDDSLSVRKVLGRRLGRLGFEVTTAQDGEEALELLREERFDALVTDLEMPRMNGYELIETVRRRPATRELPVVVITTRAGREHGDLARRLGADRYLTKPVDHDTLAELLRGMVAAAPAAGREAV